MYRLEKDSGGPMAGTLEKWTPVLEEESLPKIPTHYRKVVTAMVMENMQKTANEERQTLNEDAPVNASFASSGIDRYDPILISLVRRSLPNLMAFDTCGVQPMSGPSGIIFAMRSRYNNQTGTEALFNEADTSFSGTGTQSGSNPEDGNPYTRATGMTTAAAEALGTGGSGGSFNQMAFSIEKTTVTANSRALKAEYTIELAQDLKAVHGLDADGELMNILSQEILAEINREVIRTMYIVAKPGAASTAVPGTFDLDVDSNGRWSVERFKGLMFQIERDANVIAQETRRGRGNFVVCSSDVASALAMTGKLDYGDNLKNDLTVDDTGNTFAGILNGRYKVFIDPYSANISSQYQFCMVGYKGQSSWDAGIFYCPYVPMQMVRAVDPNSFQPKIGFKTRYGMISNPFVYKVDGTADATTFTAARNQYFRIMAVTNLL